MYNISFLKVGKYAHKNTSIGDFLNSPRPYCSLGYITKGVGEFKFKNKVITVKAGDIIFVPVGSTYISTWDKAPHSTLISLHFNYDFFFPKHNDTPLQKVSFDDPSGIDALFKDIYAQYDEVEPVKFSVLSLFFMILNKVYPRLELINTVHADPRIKSVTEYIDSHYTEDFTISDLAEIANMSISHFCSCFKNQLNCSAIEYKNKVCIHNAELMLIGNKYSIEEISEAVGYNSSIYFRKVFKEITGKTPREYRKHFIKQMKI